MKKYFLLAVLAMLSVVSFAQVPFYVKGGIGIANWTGGDVDGTDAKFAWRVGIGTELPISGSFSLQPSLYFVNKGAKINGKFEDLKGDITCQENYLEIPVMAAYRVNVAPNTNIVFNAGPYVGFGIGGKTKAKIEAGDIRADLAEIDTFGDDGALNGFDAGLGFGITGEFGQFLVGLNAQYGLTNLMEDTKVHNLSGFLTVGIKF